ncbi:SDR family NAD(P)-dependent oxidoreductase [Corynebacterium sp. TAE3-ERU12]|uniref:SDR family NAD(P)-dependent oxidoreductase n=1 Tax=Corynebacterium sp. TAE3-ERU12 TaxID=2849491 RepID=UPI001C4456C1|nr:SDR family NAD(P)-dependent oxidoreductase [Corynebacterium sp. TAE3-ERU12]MBV7294374.1 SDR family NAD(P)-dependent oxidoreductase [Corynebacterium sp. TAE3-ERU12]
MSPVSLPRFRAPTLPTTTPTALVTGASSGIGYATAEALRDAGFAVLGTSRRGTEAPHPDGITMTALAMDDPDSIAACAQRADDFARDNGHHSIGAVVLNAGESQSGPLEELPSDALERLFRVNVTGQLELAQHLLPGMRAAGRGRMVFVGSMLGTFPLPYRSSYAAAKAALRTGALALRGEVEQFGIGVTVVEPGSINTGISTRRTRYGGAADSVYTKQLTTMLKNLNANEASGISAEAVAEVIVAEITAQRPAPYRARGSRAGLVLPLSRVLPRQTMLDLIRKVHGL